MKVTFVSPMPNMAGGTRVIAIYAQLLQQRGHETSVVAPLHRAKPALANLFSRAVLKRQPRSHFDDLGVTVHSIDREGPLRPDDVPDADVIVATWWETAEWVRAMPTSKGAKVYFIQHHEIHSYLPVDRVRATYRMPLHKIVIARWLADTMAEEYGDRDVDVVPNSVDHTQFFAPLRGKRAVPTVGLMYAPGDWKRFDLAFEAIKRVREGISDLRVECFSVHPPPWSLPTYVNYTFDPPQQSLRDIYARCDIWLTASSSEGFNLPAMEAMACRTPVVSTRTGWPAEAVVDGVNGACVAIDDLEALVRETTRILSLPDADWIRLSQGAYDTVSNSSWEHSAALLEAVLQRTISRVSA